MTTLLNKQEQEWLLEQKINRITDNQEVLIYPMGAERYLASVLAGEKKSLYDISSDIIGKSILVIPGYGNSAFLFAKAGAKSITVYDKDPLTIAWVKAFKKYYHYRQHHTQSHTYPSIGELLTALTCWYPPLIRLPKDRIKNSICWAVYPNLLRRNYIFYMMSLVREAIQTQTKKDFELDKDIQFYTGELSEAINNTGKNGYDTAYIPYLLGVKNGIEEENEIVNFIQKLVKIIPKGRVLVSPAQDIKEFYFVGQRYFETTARKNIYSIPGLESYLIEEDREWFKPQGLAVFSKESLSVL